MDSLNAILQFQSKMYQLTSLHSKTGLIKFKPIHILGKIRTMIKDIHLFQLTLISTVGTDIAENSAYFVTTVKSFNNVILEKITGCRVSFDKA